MRNEFIKTLILALFALVSGAQAYAASGVVPLTIKGIGPSQSNAPVFTGMPFKPGELTDVSKIDLIVQGVSTPVQKKVLSTYPNGSIRVLLLGFRVSVGAGQKLNGEVRYGAGMGLALSPEMPWSRNLNVLALFTPRWYGDSTVFNLRFLASSDNAIFPAFESRMTARYAVTSDPPSNTAASTRPYYDHVHGVYMTLLRSGGPDSTLRRAWDEVNQYRENEVLHSGTYVGQFNGSLIGSSNKWPMDFAIVRREYILGMLDDYYVTGDARSLAVATEMGQALRKDAGLRSTDYTWTERIPGWTLMGLTAMYQQTLDSTYLDAAKKVGTIVVSHQNAMAQKYANQGGVGGLTGGYIQDRNGVWFDPEESDCAGCGSPFMTTLLSEGMIRLYWLTGQASFRNSVVKAADWLRTGCFSSNSYWYVCRDTGTGTTPSLNPMFLEVLGFAYQATGNSAFRAQAMSVLSPNDWGNHIKEFNQAQHSSGAGLYLLQQPAGSVPMTLAASGGTGPGPSPTPTPAPTASPTPSPTPTASPTPRPSQTMTVKASTDAYVNGGSASTNFAAIPSFRVGTAPSTEALFKFSVSGLTGRQIVSVKLRVHVGSNGTVNGPSLYKTSTGWSESTVTWNNRPAVTSGVLGDLGSMSPRTWYSFAVTSAVTGDGNYGFKLVGTNSDYALVDALEDGMENAAELVIEYR